MAASAALQKTPRRNPRKSSPLVDRFGPCSKWWPAPRGNSALRLATGSRLRPCATDVVGDVKTRPLSWTSPDAGEEVEPPLSHRGALCPNRKRDPVDGAMARVGGSASSELAEHLEVERSAKFRLFAGGGR